MRSASVDTDIVFPAYAGVILKAIYDLFATAGVPRVCGGDPGG